jgi:carboxylesterase
VTDLFYGDPRHEAFLLEAGPRRALLIHGFTGTPHDMRPLAEALAAAGTSAHVPLLPGFGADIDRLRHVRAEDWLAAARQAWRETRRDAERTTLIGFSMGGAVALRLATEAGLAPDELILLAPHWKFADRRALLLPLGKYVIRDFKPFARANFGDPRVRRMLAELAPEADLDDPEIRRRLRESASIPTAALDQLRRIGLAAAAAAPRVNVATTIVQGLQDTTTLPRHSRTLAARTGATLREVPGDHLLVDPSRPSWPQVSEMVVRLAAGDRVRRG